MRLIDTNVLIDYPSIVQQEDIAISWQVLEELDKIKITQGERAKKARIAIKAIKSKIDEKEDSIQFVDCGYGDSVDNLLYKYCADEDWTLVTNDINLQIKCIASGVNFEPYLIDNEIYTGILRLYLPVDNEIVCKLYSGDFSDIKLFENQYVLIYEDNEVKDILVYRNNTLNKISRNSIKISYDKDIYARNPEQYCLIDALYSDSTIIYAGGQYGSGKTFVLTSYAIQQLEKGKINKIVYVPNNSQTENSMELGYLPGSMLEKISPYLVTLIDIIGQQQVLQLYESGQLEILPISVARGRNIEDAIIMVNEAQNLTEDHVKLLVARCGENTRIFFDGDIKQADANVFRQKSGLKLLTKLRFSDEYSNLFAAVRLEQIERSKTAQAAGYLDEL